MGWVICAIISGGIALIGVIATCLRCISPQEYRPVGVEDFIISSIFILLFAFFVAKSSRHYKQKRIVEQQHKESEKYIETTEIFCPYCDSECVDEKVCPQCGGRTEKRIYRTLR